MAARPGTVWPNGAIVHDNTLDTYVARLACTSALASAAAGLLLNQVIGHLWFRERPYVEHPGSLVLFTHPSNDPSFPSDHATASFAIAVAVLSFNRRLGAAFLALAVAISVSRVLLAMHYPSDVVAGALTGVAAIGICTLARALILRLTALGARITDPVLRRIWQLGSWPAAE